MVDLGYNLALMGKYPDVIGLGIRRAWLWNSERRKSRRSELTVQVIPGNKRVEALSCGYDPVPTTAALALAL